MRIISLSIIALMASVGLAGAQAPMQAPGGADPRAGEGRRQQDGGAERLERREQRQEERAQRQDMQVNPVERGGPRQEDRAERRERREPAVRVEQDRVERRSGNRYDERVIVRDRSPTVRFETGRDVYIRTLPVQYRTIIVSGRPCRISITRRVRANGRIVTTETRQCPGRPAVVIRTRR
jgi:hypothetical protein